MIPLRRLPSVCVFQESTLWGRPLPSHPVTTAAKVRTAPVSRAGRCYVPRSAQLRAQSLATAHSRRGTTQWGVSQQTRLLPLHRVCSACSPASNVYPLRRGLRSRLLCSPVYLPVCGGKNRSLLSLAAVSIAPDRGFVSVSGSAVFIEPTAGWPRRVPPPMSRPAPPGHRQCATDTCRYLIVRADTC